MKTKNRISFFMLVFAGITLAALLTNIFIFNKYPEIVVDKNSFQLIPIFCYLIALVFHVASLFFLIRTFKVLKKYKGLIIFSLVFFVVSIISFLVDEVMINEIADDIRYGFPLSLMIINTPLIFKIVYAVLILSVVFLTLKENEQNLMTEKMDQTVFTLAQIVGIVSGILGIFLIISQIAKQVGNPVEWIPAYIIFLFPYGIIVAYWFILKIREKVADWYDEKQWKDVLRSALITLILSIPGLGLIFLLKKPLEFFWFPYYIFLVLFIFSGSTLVLFKRS